ncbi:hypothetical protein M407DRAFT_33921 [Tulasnella calospora MUT 4182]|uniref:Uncharacterized protein n=1 Tax=Tulasnella calospora MUT 4182 TaxID=1051891 RepID=A0A0C3Q266_9AGAM|nr:hypothetical protein M407DRAFT_33921 [Tulasnella calospora MUT 4182]
MLFTRGLQPAYQQAAGDALRLAIRRAIGAVSTGRKIRTTRWAPRRSVASDVSLRHASQKNSIPDYQPLPPSDSFLAVLKALSDYFRYSATHMGHARVTVNS